MKTKIIQNTKSIILALILVAGVSYVSAGTWNNPPAGTPPQNNADTPINVGYGGQIKQGSMNIKGLVSAGVAATNGLIVENGNVGIGTTSPNPARKLHVKATLPDIARFEGNGQYLDITDIGNAIRISTDGTGPLGFRTKDSTGGDQVVIDTSGKMTVEGDVCSRSVGKCLSSSAQPILNYADCHVKNVGQPDGPHSSYCNEGYINVGGQTDGNDWIPEDIICCRLRGILTENYGRRPWNGHLH